MNTWNYHKPCVQIKENCQIFPRKVLQVTHTHTQKNVDHFKRTMIFFQEVRHTTSSQLVLTLDDVAVFQLRSVGGARPGFRSHAARKIHFHSLFTCWFCLRPLGCTVGLQSMTCSSDELHYCSILPTLPIPPTLLKPALQRHGDLEPSSQFTGSTSAFLVFLWNLPNGSYNVPPASSMLSVFKPAFSWIFFNSVISSFLELSQPIWGLLLWHVNNFILLKVKITD